MNLVNIFKRCLCDLRAGLMIGWATGWFVGVCVGIFIGVVAGWAIACIPGVVGGWFAGWLVGRMACELTDYLAVRILEWMHRLLQMVYMNSRADAAANNDNVPQVCVCNEIPHHIS
jgi:uncharacterized protein YcfJ